MNLEQLPAINAALNAASTALLLMGWVFIKQGRRTAKGAELGGARKKDNRHDPR